MSLVLATATSEWRGPPPRGERIVVVAPHPDDEVLAAGGVLRWAVAAGLEVVVVAVTNGEASHPRSRRISPGELGRRRALERREALVRLGVGDTEVVELGLPDHACTRHEDLLTARLAALLGPSDTVIGPTPHDRHPDHVAVAAALARLARDGAALECWAAPTWACVHGSFRSSSRALALDEGTRSAKRRAIDAYRSQLVCLGTEPEDGPVVHPHELEAMLGPVERFADVGRRASCR